MPDVEEKLTVRIHDPDGTLCVLYSGHLRQDPDLLEKITERMKARYPQLTDADSTVPGYVFYCRHYTWYNRYNQSGDGAPKDVHPSQLTTSTCPRISQRLPELSKEAREKIEEYQNIIQDLEPLIEEVVRLLKQQLPTEYEIQAAYGKVLPLHGLPPGMVFTSLVVNVAVATDGHRDSMDMDICVLAAIGDWEGGEIVFYELGVVIDLKPGDICWFRSTDITHFNLHFKGLRASFVLTNDGAGRRWVENKNGWQPTGHVH
ncbi:hypothetical protein PUNSTDRAFT_139665 [Punctularia strigosozonata HHB-11173 SS5]|uniref:2OGFeDO JBP1/TET oxygenase domain-containing protein n=1 Tax=Punctularia strigosozonata (strain HHB-11173) TaxID=741275 RepID=R7S246_PUNST|nr:uncharacterized protein PUNSTDRAFT_139665 [Punctularia strigosozonata HHB-11173 SS5]EIN03316.1 hypothetical protein PUNSTDRAFT_139665 [Punctularia strigosozonata HHB-11173 SS5]